MPRSRSRASRWANIVDRRLEVGRVGSGGFMRIGKVADLHKSFRQTAHLRLIAPNLLGDRLLRMAGELLAGTKKKPQREAGASSKTTIGR